MSRPFSITLILLGSAILGSLIWLHFYLMGRQHEDLFSCASTVNEQTIAQKMASQDQLLWMLEYRLEEEWQQERFHEILTLVKEGKTIRDDFRKEAYSAIFQDRDKSEVELKNVDFLNLLKRKSAHELTNLRDQALALLTSKQQEFELSEWDYEERIKEIQAIAAKENYLQITSTTEEGSSFQRDVVLLNFLNTQEEIIHKLIQLTGSKADYIDAYFPVVVGGPQFPRMGDTLTALLTIGSYPRHLARSESIMIIGTDTLELGLDGFAKYQIIPQRKGLYSMPTKCIVTNPFTGEVRIGEGQFSFRAY